jgi:hypothetical protein
VTPTRVPGWFAYLAIRQHLPEFRLIAAGKATTMGHIQRHHLTGARTPLPPPEVLGAMDAVLAPIVEQRWKLDVESRLAGRSRTVPRSRSGSPPRNGPTLDTATPSYSVASVRPFGVSTPGYRPMRSTTRSAV